MAYADVVKLDAYLSWVEFDATFQSGATRRWGTAYALWPTGRRTDGIMRVSPISSGIGEAHGARPERVTVNVELIDDGGGDMQDLLAGTSGVIVGVEYSGDGMPNLTGRMYHCVQDPLTGERFRSAVTPTLHLAGDVEFDGQRAVLPLSSVDDDLLGKSWRPITARMLMDSALATVNEDLEWWAWDAGMAGGASGSEAPGAWNDHTAMWDAHLDDRVAWVYGRCAIPLQCVTSRESNDGKIRYLVGVFASAKEPYYSSFPDWELRARTSNDVLLSKQYVTRLYKTKRKVTLEDASTTEVWVLWIEMDAKKRPTREDLVTDQVYATPSIYTLGLAGVAPPPLGDLGPAKIAEELIKDHAPSGSSARDSTSFSRCKRALKNIGFGGVYYGDAPVADPLSLLGEASGLAFWISNVTGIVHAIPTGAWNGDDKAAVDAGTLDHIRQSDVVGGWAEVIPRDPDRRGSVPSRVELRWSDEQREYHSLRYLYRSVPGATDLPVGKAAIAEIDASWVFPPMANVALTGIASRRAFITRRVRATVRGWVASKEYGTLFALSHGLGLEVSAAGGYRARIVRLERGTFDPMRGTFEAVFEDLGQIVNIKPWKVDELARWEYAKPVAQSLTVVAGSKNVTASAAFFTGVAADWEGRYLDTSGAANQSNCRQTRIDTWVSDTQVTVEFDFNVNETITAGTLLGSVIPKWSVVRAYTKEGSGYRPAYGKAALPTGLMRNGDPGWQIMGG